MGDGVYFICRWGNTACVKSVIDKPDQVCGTHVQWKAGSCWFDLLSTAALAEENHARKDLAVETSHLRLDMEKLSGIVFNKKGECPCPLFSLNK